MVFWAVNGRMIRISPTFNELLTIFRSGFSDVGQQLKVFTNMMLATSVASIGVAVQNIEIFLLLIIFDQVANL